MEIPTINFTVNIQELHVHVAHDQAKTYLEAAINSTVPKIAAHAEEIAESLSPDAAPSPSTEAVAESTDGQPDQQATDQQLGAPQAEPKRRGRPKKVVGVSDDELLAQARELAAGDLGGGAPNGAPPATSQPTLDVHPPESAAPVEILDVGPSGLPENPTFAQVLDVAAQYEETTAVLDAPHVPTTPIDSITGEALVRIDPNALEVAALRDKLRARYGDETTRAMSWLTSTFNRAIDRIGDVSLYEARFAIGQLDIAANAAVEAAAANAAATATAETVGTPA